MLDGMQELVSISATTLNLDRDEIVETDFALQKLVFRAVSVSNGRRWIRCLRLEGLFFPYGEDTFPRLPGMQGLKHLQLVLCGCYVPFLYMLTDLSLNLATFTIVESEIEGGGFSSHANEFIQSLSSPERLHLTLDSDFDEPDTLLDWSTLHRYASAIKSLKVQYHSSLPPYPIGGEVGLPSLL